MKKTRSRRVDTYVVESKEQKYKEQVRELRAINRKLTRENSRLKKEIKKTDDILMDYEIREAVELIDNIEVVEKPEKDSLTCSSCNKHEIMIIDAGIKEVLVCMDCKHRSTRNKKDEENSAKI